LSHPKRQLYGGKVFVNIRMVKLDIIHYRDLGQVVHELWAFVEIGSVVFVAFDDEVVAPGHPKADAKILRDASNQECRVKPPLVQYPGSNAGGRGLAVRARDDQRSAAANEFFLYHFSLRAIEKFSVEC
jgi:hypothetical protein